MDDVFLLIPQNLESLDSENDRSAKLDEDASVVIQSILFKELRHGGK